MNHRRRHEPIKIHNEVNITPLVDTCLVLLIMFMIATPFMVQQTVPVNLPKSQNSKQQRVDNQLSITITHSKQDDSTKFYFMQDKTAVDIKELKSILSKRLPNKENDTVFLYSDGTTPMQDIVTLVDMISAQGGKISLITESGK